MVYVVNLLCDSLNEMGNEWILYIQCYFQYYFIHAYGLHILLFLEVKFNLKIG